MMSHLIGVVTEIWRTFADASFFILAGFFIAGLVQVFVDSEKIAKQLGKPGLRSVVLAAVFGVPLPLCSCGVIPMAVSLRQKGASKGAVLSFLIATPESGIDSIAISYAFLDPLMTVFRPVAAFITAIAAGIGENVFGKREEAAPVRAVCGKCCGSREEAKAGAGVSFVGRLGAGMRYAFVDLLGDVAKWLIIGIAAGGVISYVIPPDFIGRFLGADLSSMLMMLVIGIPLYICASASTPIAAALIAKGMSPGTALVFLLAGPATNVAGILTVGKFLGKRSAVIYLLAIAVSSILFGLALNALYRYTGVNIRSVMGHACDLEPQYIKIISSVILLSLMAYAFIKKRA